MANNESAVRAELKKLLEGKGAHVDVLTALAGFPFEDAGKRPHGLPYSAWQLLEHMRFTLADLLTFSTDSHYEAPAWPDDYWVKDPQPPSADAWKTSVNALKADLQAFEKLVSDANSNLHDVIPWADKKQTLFHEALLAADHTSYHTGEFIVLRRLLGNWKK